MEWGAFQGLIRQFFVRTSGVVIGLEEDRIRFSIDGREYTYTLQDYDELNANLSNYNIKPTSISNSNMAEMLIDPLDSRFGFRYQDDGIVVSDDNISYAISVPSNEMILAFISSIPHEEIRSYRRPMLSHGFSQRYNGNGNDDISLFDLLLRCTRLSLSLKVSTTSSTPIEVFQKYANSFLFNLAYNTGAVFKPVTDVAELSMGRGYAVSRHLLRVDELEVPKLFYDSELTEQYSLASSSNDPFIKYIAYYHIMEHFFDEVYNGALISSVKEVLLHPGFSVKKPKEISKIIDVVQQKTRATKEGFQGSELEALELTIKTFVSIENLYRNLYEYSPNYVEYYKTHEVTFSNGDTVNLEDFSNDKLPKKIAARIYKTRNSLVHSKSNNARVRERGIYHPFSDEKELVREIPLVKLIAEDIIINSAVEI